MMIIRLLKIIKNYPFLLYETFVDSIRYLNHSMFIQYRGDSEKHIARITATYHNLEKGLSLANPRIGFGKERALKLLSLIEEYINDYGCSRDLDVALSVLTKYYEFNKFEDIKSDTNKLISRNNIDVDLLSLGGTKNVSKSEILKAVNDVSADFFLSRSSVRQFEPGYIDNKLIQEAVIVAQKCPVVCNRQSGKVYTIRNKGLIKEILQLHGGARGFENDIETLFCITVDIKNFMGVGERYQFYIDGGLFAMSFLLGLHMNGIGTCCLNWSKTNKQDREMSKLLSLPLNEKIIMFIGAGHLKEQFKVAKSHRKQIDEVLTFID